MQNKDIPWIYRVHLDQYLKDLTLYCKKIFPKKVDDTTIEFDTGVSISTNLWSYVIRFKVNDDQTVKIIVYKSLFGANEYSGTFSIYFEAKSNYNKLMGNLHNIIKSIVGKEYKYGKATINK